jgi:uncharacterized protein (UPF0335 family)
MNHSDLALTAVDELGMLLAQIADLEKRADAIKTEMKEIASLNGVRGFDGAMYRATYVEANRTATDYKKLCAELGITAAQIAQYTRTTAVYSIKVTSR